jgi:3-oxoacyl-[acyl-carrier-protein] synthase-3
MASAAAPAAFLAGPACYLPSRVVTNAELAGLTGVEAEWIRTSSGIEERRYAAADETVVDLAVAAARKCLESAGPANIGMVFVSSGTADRRWPGPAAAVARALNLGPVPAIDLPMPSAGGLFGLALASQLMGMHEDVLVVAAEKMSSVVTREGTHPNVAVLFGDGAGACLVSRRQGIATITGAILHTDGTLEESLHLGLSEPLHMDGRTIIMQAARKLPQVIEEILAAHHVDKEQVSSFLLHQANQNILVQAGRALGVPQDKVFSNIRLYGNTSSASVLIALAEWSVAQGFQPGRPVVMAAFGAGLHWGAVLLSGL